MPAIQPGEQEAAAEIPIVTAPELAQYISQDMQERSNRLQLDMEDRQERKRRQNEAEQKAEAKEQAQCVPPCDGSSPKVVREWIREVQLTIPYTNRTIYVAQKTARGLLRTELEYFLNSQPNRQLVTWFEVRQFLQSAFLSPHEDERLRHELENIKQGAFETSAFFGRRFRAAAELAYPSQANGARNDDQNRIILKAYLKGLTEKFLKHRLIRDGRPETLEQAMSTMERYEADEIRVRMAEDEGTLERYEEPMEVGAMAAREGSSSELGDMKRQITGLTQQFTKLMATLQKNDEQKRPPAEGRPPRDNRPRRDGRAPRDKPAHNDSRPARDNRNYRDNRRQGPTDDPNPEHTFVYAPTSSPPQGSRNRRGRFGRSGRGREERHPRQERNTRQQSGGY